MLIDALYQIYGTFLGGGKVTCSDIDGVDRIVKWDASLGPQPTQAQIDAAIIIVMARKATEAANVPTMQQIATLEASISSRRIREHLTGVNVTFVPAIDAQIAALRATLVK